MPPDMRLRMMRAQCMCCNLGRLVRLYTILKNLHRR